MTDPSNEQIVGVLTATQRLIILEGIALRPTETFDLMPKRILHRNVFGSHLHPLVNQMDEEGSTHPQIADAFYGSFRTYKGRVFLLVGFPFFPSLLHSPLSPLPSRTQLTHGNSANMRRPSALSRIGPIAFSQ